MRPNTILGCGIGWTQPDCSGFSLLVPLCLQPLLSKGGDVAGGNSSCWESCVGLNPNGTEACSRLRFFFKSFYLVFKC